MTARGLGRVKTKSDLVVMPSGRQIFAFFCSPHDRRAQNSGCDYTPQSFTQPGSVTEVVQIHSNVRLGLPPEANIVLAVAMSALCLGCVETLCREVSKRSSFGRVALRSLFSGLARPSSRP